MHLYIVPIFLKNIKRCFRLDTESTGSLYWPAQLKTPESTKPSMTPTDLPERKAYLLRQKTEHHRNVLGVFPAVYPREILWSLEILPVEIWDPPLQSGRSAAHLPPNVCDVARNALELILAGHCKELDGFLFPHTCDSLQNLASIVNDHLDTGKPCFFFHPPRQADSRAARVFYRQQLEDLAAALGKHFHRPPAAVKLSESVQWGQRIDAAVCKLYDLRGTGRLNLGNASFYRILRCTEYLHPLDCLPLLQRVCENGGSAPSHQTPVVLSGVLPGPPSFLNLLDDLDLRVAADDLLSCSRRLQVPGGPVGQPFEALTDRYFRMPVCSTRNATSRQRSDHLLTLVRSTRAAGVIFYVPPFCDPELFALPTLVAELKKASIPFLVVEAGLNRQLSGQVAVRVEAFAEMLGAAAA